MVLPEGGVCAGYETGSKMVAGAVRPPCKTRLLGGMGDITLVLTLLVLVLPPPLLSSRMRIGGATAVLLAVGLEAESSGAVFVPLSVAFVVLLLRRPAPTMLPQRLARRPVVLLLS
jgi:hypothetical protein